MRSTSTVLCIFIYLDVSVFFLVSFYLAKTCALLLHHGMPVGYSHVAYPQHDSHPWWEICHRPICVSNPAEQLQSMPKTDQAR